MAEPARQLPEEDQPRTQPNLGVVQGGGEGDGQPKGNLSEAQSDPYDNSQSEKPVTRPDLHAQEGGGEGNGRAGGNLHDANAEPAGDLKKREENGVGGGGADADKEGGLYHDEDEGRFGKARGRLQSLRKGAASNKLLIGAGISGTGLITLVILLLLFVGSLKIPDLAAHITSYEFARVTRQFSQSAQRATDEELALDATDSGASNSLYNSLKEKYANATTPIRETWSKLDNYRPQKVIETLGTKQKLQLNFENNQFVGGTLDGVEFSIEKQGLTRFVPGLSSIISFKNNLDFSRDFAPALESAMAANEVGPIIRGVTADSIRKELGIGLIAWQVGKYQGENATEARNTEELQKIDEVEGTNPTPTEGVVDTLNSDEQAATAAEEQTLSTTAGVESVINNGGVVQSVKDAIGNAVANTPLETVLSIASPAAAATPLCIVYDGSLDKSGPVIDNQARQQQAAYYYAASGSDQQKNGSDPADPSGAGLSLAVGAANDDFGDITQSNAEIRAGGGSVDTSSSISAEASAGGEFTLFNVLGLPSAANSIADSLCPTLTNVWVQIGLGVGNILAQFIPGVDAGVDGGDAAVETAGQTAQVIINNESQSLAAKLVSKFIGEKATNFVNKTGNLLFDTGKNAAKIAAATVFAKLIVLARAGQIDSGTAQGTDLSNEADSGGNIQANELERTQLFGRPLLQTEVCTSNSDDHLFLGDQESQQNSFNRYLAVNNPDSLVSHVGIMFNGNLNGSIFNSLSHLAGEIFRPMTLISSLTNLFWGHAAAANCANNDSSDYGNVQFGWSDAEESLIDSNDNYRSSLENQAILDTATNGGEAAIAKQYRACFGYKYNASGDGSFDPTDPNGYLALDSAPGGSGSLGTLLSSGAIVRDSHGNVLDQRLCSPSNLSYNNGNYGPQMVFRWRLAMQYDTTFDQLTNEQSVSNNASTSQ